MAYTQQGVSSYRTSNTVPMRYMYNGSWINGAGWKARVYYDQKYDINANKSQISLYIDFITDGEGQQGIYYVGDGTPESSTKSGLYINGSLIAPMSYYSGKSRVNLVDGNQGSTMRYQYSSNGSDYSNWSYQFIVNHNPDGTGSFTLELKDVSAVYSVNSNAIQGGEDEPFNIEEPYDPQGNTLEPSGTADINGGTVEPSVVNPVISINNMGTNGSMKISTQTITLTTIPRTSNITATNANIGSASTISINRSSNSFTHTLQYKITGQDSFTTIVSKTTSTSYQWTIPTSAYSYVAANSKSVVITIRCYTYNGNTSLGTTTTTLTAYTTADACKPTLTKSYQILNDTSALTGSATKAILNWSNVKITLSATAKHGASITRYQIVHNGNTFTGSTNTYNKIQVNTFTCRATDSRGYTTESVLTIPSISYFKPTITPKTIPPEVETGDTKTSASGNVFTGSFGSANNSITVQYRYKVDGGSYGSWTNLTVNTTTNKYTTSNSTIQLDYTKKYIFQARITDSLQTITSSAYEVIKIPVFSWSKNDFQFNVKVLLSKASYDTTLPPSGVEGQVFIKI